VDWSDADGIGLLGAESTNPPILARVKNHLHRTAPLQWRSEIMSATGVARPMSIIMRAILHQGAANTYYGQWLCVFPKE
jgi:hypothetical protein